MDKHKRVKRLSLMVIVCLASGIAAGKDTNMLLKLLPSLSIEFPVGGFTPDGSLPLPIEEDPTAGQTVAPGLPYFSVVPQDTENFTPAVNLSYYWY